MKESEKYYARKNRKSEQHGLILGLGFILIILILVIGRMIGS
jgi:hypothetical protein